MTRRRAGERRAELAALQRRHRGDRGIEAGTPFLRASPRRGVRELRARRPRARAAAPGRRATRSARAAPGAATILVSGNTARFIDEKQSLVDHLPLVAAIVAATTLLLLFLLTGSVILPLKTLLMNALTLAAALGVIVLAFQDGLLDGLLGYTGPAAIEVTSLVVPVRGRRSGWRRTTPCS